MNVDKLNVSSRLNILLGLATTAFSTLLLIAYFGLGHLGELQDSGFKRGNESVGAFPDDIVIDPLIM